MDMLSFVQYVTFHSPKFGDAIKILHICIVKISIKDSIGSQYDGFIEQAVESDIRSLCKQWKFNWEEIFQSDQLTFKLVKDEEIQGLLKLTRENDQYVIMENIEVSPSNFGSKGQYINIAELLISFASYQTFKINKGSYIGYLAFTSKGSLIDYYQENYDAELVFRERMIIAPQSALKLIKKHLKLNLKK